MLRAFDWDTTRTEAVLRAQAEVVQDRTTGYKPGNAFEVLSEFLAIKRKYPDAVRALHEDYGHAMVQVATPLSEEIRRLLARD